VSRTSTNLIASCGAITLLWLSGCTVGPNYKRPQTQAPLAYKETAPGWQVAQPNDAMQRGKWWELYNDPTLNALEERVTVSNETLKGDVARYDAARAAVRLARSQYFPTVSVDPQATTARQSTNRPLARNAGTTQPITNYNDILLPLDASWEPDLWGRVRRTVRQSAESAQASAADLENASLSLHAELAMDYFQLRSLDKQKQLLDENAAAFQKTVELTENRFHGGLASDQDVELARTQLATTVAQGIDVGVARAQFEHAIAVLTGQQPEQVALALSPLDALPPAIPLGLPGELLERRPDIAAAERRMAAANEQIGIARAAYFPNLLISASGGVESGGLNNLFSGSSGLFAVGGTLTETLFDGGARRAATEQARANYDATVADYRQDILTAFQQVEDNLAALRILEQEQTAEQVAVTASQRSVELSLNRYKGGVAAYIEVLTAQSNSLTSQRTATDIQGRRMTASVELIKALGGGWNSSKLPTPY
jgi:NodT family efflux transporter outer membrane factor (OMF) lipoprotein